MSNEQLDTYLEEHGLTFEIIAQAGCKYTNGKLVIPTATGNRYRHFNGDSKYTSDKGYTICLFGLDRAIAMAGDNPLVIANGEIGTMAAQHHSIPAFCITAGEKEQMPGHLLRELMGSYQGNEIAIPADCDTKGHRAAHGIAEQLRSFGYAVRVLELPFEFVQSGGKDIADWCKHCLDNNIDPLTIYDLPDLQAPQPQPTTTSPKPKPKQYDDDVKETIRQRFDMLNYARQAFPGCEVDSRPRNGQYEVHSQGGLYICLDTNGIWKWAIPGNGEGFGGDCFNLVSYTLFRDPKRTKNKEDFKRILEEAARFAGVSLDRASQKQPIYVDGYAKCPDCKVYLIKSKYNGAWCKTCKQSFKNVTEKEIKPMSSDGPLEEPAHFADAPGDVESYGSNEDSEFQSLEDFGVEVDGHEDTTTNGNGNGNGAKPPQNVPLPINYLWTCHKEDEAGDAKMFAHIQHNRYVYGRQTKRWHRFVGPHWETCNVPPYTSVYRDVASQYLMLAAMEQQKGTDDKIVDAIMARVKSLRTQRRINSVFALASELMEFDDAMWDLDPWTLAVQNGVIDLRTGELRKGKPEEYMHTISPTEYKGLDEPAPRWEQFLGEVFDYREDIIKYFQLICGQGITGYSEKVLPILWGEFGWNGRTTMLETIQSVLGDYATAVPKDTVVGKREMASGAATPHLMTLKGKRLVWASESKEGAKLNEETIKKITGRDTITARGLHQDFITFEPTHTILFLVNHAPQANSDDNALWERVKFIPFTVSFVPNPKLDHERQADLHIKEKLESEKSGILAWLVRGCLEWQQEPQGLTAFQPDEVTVATNDQRKENDIIEQFIEEKCIKNENAFVVTTKLYEVYEEWCGGRALHITEFGKKLKRKGYEKQQKTIGGNRHNCYVGIGLAAAETQQQDAPPPPQPTQQEMETTPQQQPTQDRNRTGEDLLQSDSDHSNAENGTQSDTTAIGATAHAKSFLHELPHEGKVLDSPIAPIAPVAGEQHTVDERSVLLSRIAALDSKMTPPMLCNETNDDLRMFLADLEQQHKPAGSGDSLYAWQRPPEPTPMLLPCIAIDCIPRYDGNHRRPRRKQRPTKEIELDYTLAMIDLPAIPDWIIKSQEHYMLTMLAVGADAPDHELFDPAELEPTDPPDPPTFWDSLPNHLIASYEEIHGIEPIEPPLDELTVHVFSEITAYNLAKKGKVDKARALARNIKDEDWRTQVNCRISALSAKYRQGAAA